MAATAPMLEPSTGADGPLPRAKAEAIALWGLVEQGSSTVEAVRGLIEVSPADEERLRAFAEAEPEFAPCVVEPLRFRGRVL